MAGRYIVIISIVILLASCNPSQNNVPPALTYTPAGITVSQTNLPDPTQVVTPSAMPSETAAFQPGEQAGATTAPNRLTAVPHPGTPSLVLTATPASTRKPPKYWAEWPLIPTVSEKASEIFKRGQANGLDVHAFSTIGDCQSQPSVFMGIYDSDHYQLPEGYESLKETIDQFQGSFKRDDITVKDGQSVISVFSPLWADPQQCNSGESPLDCEFRLHKPVIVFINLGTNWNGGNEKKHEQYLRKIVDAVIAKGAVPILSSKGDNLEGGHRINESTARVAFDYQLPFWNFWLSIRDLPGKGIDGTREGGYLIPEAWDRRSFTGLRALDAVWRALKATMQ